VTAVSTRDRYGDRLDFDDQRDIVDEIQPDAAAVVTGLFLQEIGCA
jgi:hypothetical protein